MKTDYNFKSIPRLFVLLLTALIFTTFVANGQCIQPVSWGGGTIDNTMTTPTVFSFGNWAGEYAPTTVSDAGQYEISSTNATDHLTVTDDNDIVITHGTQPVTVTFTSTGNYRVHISVDTSCATENVGRDLLAEYLGPPGPPPACPSPTSLTVSNITTGDADLDWTENGSATEWQIEWDTAGFTQGTGNTIITTSNPFNLTGLSPMSGYDFYVRSICSAGDTSSWAGPETFSTPFQCPSGAYCFTNAGATGAFGPTQADIDAEYGPNDSLHNMVTSSNGIQVWEVPTAGLYKITAYGAEGGFEPGNNEPAGLGAMMSGEFSFGTGDTLLVLVGQAGEGVSNGGGTGGGGSFVTYADSTPLVVAAGGSGAPNSTNFGELNGKITNRGPDGGSGHTSSTSGGGGGGGFLTDGTNGSTDQTFNGRAFVNGGEGGTGSGGDGGFGGGGGKGGTFNDGAGGGGYSGGDNTYDAVTYGGGGSFNDGVNQVNQEGVKEDHGIVIIEALPSPSCLFPANLNAVNVTPNSADLQWQENGSATSWDVEYGVEGFSQGTGTMISGTSNNPLSVTGLNQLTDYEFYVRSVCGSGDTSEWVGPVSFQTPCPAGLSGTFTIGTSPADDFSDFQSAVEAITQCGVSGPVLFNVEPGVYNEQIVIGQVPGISSSDTVVFRGQDPATTEISFEQNTSSDRYTVRFEDASYITFDSITIRAEDAGTYGWSVHIYDDANNLNFNNVHFITEVTSSTFNLGMVVSGSETGYTTDVSGTVSDIKIHDSYFEGGRAGARMNGSTSQDITGVEVVNCEFNEVDRNGLYYSRVSDFTIHNNLINISPNGSTFGAGVWLTNCGNFDITANEVHEAGRYGFYNTNSGGTSANRSLYANNVVTPVRNTGNFTGGIRILNFSSEYIDVIHNSFHFDADGRVFNISNNSPSNIRIWNNNFVNSSTGSGEAMYVSDESSVEAIDYNNYYTAGSDFVYYGSARADLAALQAVNTPANNDANSVSADPLFIASDNLLPLSDQIDDEGLGLPQVPIDILGNPRDPNNPSIGAYEFVAPDVDLALIEVQLAPSECLGSNDSIYFTVENTIGSTVDFSVDNLNFHWNVTGPINSNGTITVNSGNLAQGDSLEVGGDGVDMSVPGNYVVSLAYIDTNAVNESTVNDTLLNAADEDIAPLLAVSPKIDTVYIPGDSVELSAQSPFFPGGDFFFTEICHWRTASTGAPSTWPAWLPSVDYVEVTGVPNSDLEGITLEQWTETALDDSYTFPSGTVLGPNGTAIIRIGSGSAGSDPANFYYDGVGGSASFFSGAESGKVLKDANGNVIDAVGYPGSSTYSFPAASGVTTADWSGNVPAASGTAGIRLEGAYTKDATNWIVSSAASPQDPNTVNSGVTVPVPGNLTGFSWNYQSAVIDTNVETTVGPFTSPSIHEYIAEYTGTPCGNLSDTSTIVVSFTDIDLVSSNDPCFGSADGEIVVTSNGGQAPFTYAWSDDPSRTGATATGLVAGTYGITVTDTNGISDSMTVTLTDPPALSLSVTEVPSSCGLADGELNTNVSGGTTPYSYAWSDGSTSSSLTGLAAGVALTVTVTDANGCQLIDSGAVTNPSAPSLSLNIDKEIDCGGDTDGEISTTVSGGTPPHTYAWSNGASSSDLIGVGAGTYEVTVTDSASCSVVGNVTLSEPDSLLIDSAALNHVSCHGFGNGSIIVSVTGGETPYSYNWSNSASSSNITGLTPGTYDVTVTDGNGCQVTESYLITEPSAPLSTTISNQVNVSCNGGTDGEATVSVSGGTVPYTYEWDNGMMTPTATGLSAGSYLVTVTDSNNCQTVRSVNITEPSALQAGIMASSDVSCNGGSDGSASALAQGGTSPYTYNWSNSATGSMVTGLSQGSYDVTVTDDNGCTEIASVTIDEPSALTVSISSSTDVTCNGSNNGTATVTASGGTPGYSYSWSNGQGNSTASGLTPGTHGVTVTDANGCSDSATVTITEPDLLEASLQAAHVSCNGGTDGELQAAVNGGTQPYSYNWSNGDTGHIADSLTAGLYLVTVMDANNCQTTLSSFVNEPSVLNASAEQTETVSCNGGSDGEASVTASGGTSPYNYAWSSGDSTATATGLSAGMHHVTVTDDNGCMTTDSAEVTEPDELTASVDTSTVSDASCFGSSDGTAEVTVQGGTTPYNYAWDNGEAAAQAMSLPGGTAEVTVTDANGCMTTVTVEIDEPAQLDTAVMLIDNGAFARASLDTSAAIYTWYDCDEDRILPGADERDFKPSQNGNFRLIVELDGCVDSSACFNLTNTSAGDVTADDFAMKVYPNPTRGMFNVRLTGRSSEVVHMQIVDMQGKQLMNRNLGRLDGEYTEELNMNLAAGVYFVKVIRDGELNVERVVVQ